MSWKDFPANWNLKLDYIIRDQAKFSWRKKLKYFFSKLVPSPVLTCYAIHSNATSIPFRDTLNVTYLQTFRDLKRVHAGEHSCEHKNCPHHLRLAKWLQLWHIKSRKEFKQAFQNAVRFRTTQPTSISNDSDDEHSKVGGCLWQRFSTV